jgi:hypothetical protein
MFPDLEASRVRQLRGSKNGETKKTEEPEKKNEVFFFVSPVFSGSPFFDPPPGSIARGR